MPKSKFKEAMAHVATSVSVLSCCDGPEILGMTISSLTSVGLNPPTVSVCVEGKSQMVDVIRNARRFGVTVLRAEQQAVGKTFSHPQTPYADRFKGSAYEIINQCPLIQGGLAMMTCEVVHEVPISENVVFFGRVTHVESHSGQPLMYFLRNWQEIAR